MKHLLSITISLFCAITIINAQSCLPGGITFSSQQQIDDFQTNYPGCTEIEGYVRIAEAVEGDIINLYGLENITSIGGYLRINNNAALQNLNGLYNLTSIGGYLKILANDNLWELSSLQNLTTIGDELNISGNDLLSSLNGLDNVTSIGGYLRIAYSDALTDIHGIEHIFNEGIESNDPAIDDLVIIHNPLLSHCAMDNICLLVNDGFTTIEIHNNAEGCSYLEFENACANSCMSSGVTFTSQQQIDDFLTNYPSCSIIAGDARIDETNAGDITNVDGLSQVVLIKGDLGISGNSGLTDLNGLGNLEEIEGWFGLIDNDALVNLEGLQNLNNIEYGFEIVINPSLINLNGLEGLSSVGGRFYVVENPALVSLEGLDNLVEVGSTFWIGDNNALAGLDGLQSLAVVGESLDISGNDNLTSLEGLESLETISYIYVRANESLPNLTGLESLQVATEIRILYNQNLIHLTGLENLQSVDDNIIIESNPNLTSLTGLEALTDVGYFSCNYNPSLAYCANEHICTLIESLSPNAFGFANNALGCNSTEEVEQACQPTCLEGGITFTSQQEIDDFTASYANCSMVMGDVIIDETTIGDIIDLSALSLLTTIEGGLQISGNFSLSNLSGLENLTAINGSLKIFGNAALSNVAAFQNIDPTTVNASSGGDDIEIYSNPQLSQCAIENICAVLQQPGNTNNIHNNAVGCNTAEEVEAACLLNATTVANGPDPSIHLSPNPVSDLFIVALKNYSVHPDNIQMSIYSTLGTPVAFESNRIGSYETSLKLASSTPAGIYILRVTDGLSQFTSTFVFTP